MEKKKITVVSLDPRAGASYAKDVRGLFGDHADVSVFNVMDGSAMGKLERADLFAVSTDAYGSAEEVARHVPMGCQTMAIEVSFRWRELRRLKAIPAGSKVLFVNMTQAMAREAITQLNQFGINHIHLIPFYPGAVLEEGVHIAVTPDEMRYVPEEIETKLDLGQRPCTSGMMIEIALRLGLEELLETERFQAYFRSIATSNYSFDLMFSRSIRLESQFHILMGILEDGIIGVNEKGEIFACNKRAEEITRVKAPFIMGKRCDAVFAYLPFLPCLLAPGYGRRQVLHGDLLMSGIDKVFHHIVELPDISRPWIRPQERLYRLRQLEIPAQLSSKMLNDQEHVLSPLRQRRDHDRERVQPIVQIPTEAPAFYLLFQRLIGSRHDPDIDLDHPVPAHPHDLPLLEHPEELDLQGLAHPLQLIQEQGPFMGKFKQSGTPALFRAGERAFLISKKLALQQVLRHRRHIDRQKRSVLPSGRFVYRMGEQLLPCAGLPDQKDRALAGRHPL